MQGPVGDATQSVGWCRLLGRCGTAPATRLQVRPASRNANSATEHTVCACAGARAGGRAAAAERCRTSSRHTSRGGSSGLVCRKRDGWANTLPCRNLDSVVADLREPRHCSQHAAIIWITPSDAITCAPPAPGEPRQRDTTQAVPHPNAHASLRILSTNTLPLALLLHSVTAPERSEHGTEIASELTSDTAGWPASPAQRRALFLSGPPSPAASAPASWLVPHTPLAPAGVSAAAAAGCWLLLATRSCVGGGGGTMMAVMRTTSEAIIGAGSCAPSLRPAGGGARRRASDGRPVCSRPACWWACNGEAGSGVTLWRSAHCPRLL